MEQIYSCKDNFMRHYPFLAVATMAEARLEKGRRKYGDDAYWYRDILTEIQEELLDIMNYAYLQWLKVQRLKEQLEEYDDWMKMGGTD